jgi:hypothetical protein
MKCIILLISILNLFNVECSKERIIFLRSNLSFGTVNFRIIGVRFKTEDKSPDFSKSLSYLDKHSDIFHGVSALRFIQTEEDYDIFLWISGEEVKCRVERSKSTFSPETEIKCPENKNIHYGRELGYNGIIIGDKTKVVRNLPDDENEKPINRFEGYRKIRRRHH